MSMLLDGLKSAMALTGAPTLRAIGRTLVSRH